MEERKITKITFDAVAEWAEQSTEEGKPLWRMCTLLEGEKEVEHPDGSVFHLVDRYALLHSGVLKDIKPIKGPVTATITLTEREPTAQELEFIGRQAKRRLESELSARRKPKIRWKTRFLWLEVLRRAWSVVLTVAIIATLIAALIWLIF